MESRYTVWVGGTELTDYAITYAEAVELQCRCLALGYDDVQIEQVQ
jgi:hypothetical protein